MGKKKLTYTFVKNKFEEDGYSLLSTEYINCGTKLKYKCPEGHTHSISWANWQQGGRCAKCAIDKKAENKRLNINLIKSEFEREGYTLE
jgi:peptide subunit release factor 1 (eRF1)